MIVDFGKQIHDRIVNDFYEKISKEISSGQIMGYPIDFENPKEVAFAFYYYCESTHSRWTNGVGDIL